MSEGNKKLLNQTQFAKACGVAISTIRNRVNKGCIIPAHSVGGKDYFTEDQIISMQLATLRGSVTQSFIALICEDDDSAYAEATATFVDKVKCICPSAHSILSLADSMESMGVASEFKLTESTTPVFRGKVIDKFLVSVRSMVNDNISRIYLEEPASRAYSYQFFLDVITEDETNKPDESLVASYTSCGITNVKYLLPSLKLDVSTQFRALKSKYGIYSCCEKSGFTLRDALYSDGRVLLGNNVDIIYDSNASGARAVFESLRKEVKGSLVKSGISTVYQDGFYTSIRISSDITDKDVVSIISVLSTGDYKTIYIPSRDKLPEMLLAFIDMKVSENVLRLLQG